MLWKRYFKSKISFIQCGGYWVEIYLLAIVNKLVCTTVIYFKMATPSNVNKTTNEEKITPDAKRVKLFSGVWCWKNGFD